MTTVTETTTTTTTRTTPMRPTQKSSSSSSSLSSMSFWRMTKTVAIALIISLCLPGSIQSFSMSGSVVGTTTFLSSSPQRTTTTRRLLSLLPHQQKQHGRPRRSWCLSAAGKGFGNVPSSSSSSESQQQQEQQQQSTPSFQKTKKKQKKKKQKKGTQAQQLSETTTTTVTTSLDTTQQKQNVELDTTTSLSSETKTVQQEQQQQEPVILNSGQRALEVMRRKRVEEKNAQLEQMRQLTQMDEQVRDTPAALPEIVAQRMGIRMITFVGIPFVLGLSSFVMFWYFATIKQVEFQPVLVAITTIVILVTSLLGITYSVMSTSWDEDREGNFLGMDEFKTNVANIQEGLDRSKENAILRDKMTTSSRDWKDDP